MEGWQIVTAVIGVATVIGSTYASIFKMKKTPPPERPAIQSQVSPERMAKLEAQVQHARQENARLHADFAEVRRQLNETVNGIYTAIDDVRKMVIRLLENS